MGYQEGRGQKQEGGEFYREIAGGNRLLMNPAALASLFFLHAAFLPYARRWDPRALQSLLLPLLSIFLLIS